MGMTPLQRKKLRRYVALIRQRKEREEMLKFKSKIFSWIKKIAKVGFWFFLIKGILWLCVLYFGVKIF